MKNNTHDLKRFIEMIVEIAQDKCICLSEEDKNTIRNSAKLLAE
ncbi:hypothetical protein Ga0466249_002269 [Sporomusaceae bacterium BoRhaA]|nr:hypothetical protein [Pelorhabdus rhamnosifermentans]MBU2701155.1 hypothetical protein [Pelorhabdus rhamnosifermentans]